MFPNQTSASSAGNRGTQRNPLRIAPGTDQERSSPPTDWLDEWNGTVVSTATAVSALVLSEQHGGGLGEIGEQADIDSAYQGDLSELLVGSMHWLARRQQDDGGWCNIPGEPSQLLTSMVVRSTFQLTGAPAAYPELTSRMVQFIKQRGGVDHLKATYGAFHSATLLVRGCYALAEVVDWKQLPTIPIERASFDNSTSRVEFWTQRGPALPAIVALGIASYHLQKPLNPLTNWRRMGAAERGLHWLAENQAADGSFRNSIAVTSIVLMSLASIGQTESPMVRRGVEFLFDRVRSDGSWPACNVSSNAAADAQPQRRSEGITVR